jgi:gas vesicle protein
MTSFLKGALAGAALAFLYAPSRGDETRTRMRGEIESLLDRLQSGLRDVGATVSEQLDELRARAEAALEPDTDAPDGPPEA